MHPRGPERSTGTTARATQAAVRREQLLSTALRLFAEHGYAATSTKRIAQVAGVTEGLIFHYFDNKEALLLELASRNNTFAGRVLAETTADDERSARVFLQRIAKGFAEVSEDEARLVAIINSEAPVNPALRTPITAGTNMMIAAIVERLSKAVERGELRRDASLQTAVIGFFGGFSFYFSQYRPTASERWRRDASAFADAWAEQCWRGIASDEWLSAHTTNSATAPARGKRVRKGATT